MSSSELTPEEIEEFKNRLVELKLEHRGLDEAIDALVGDSGAIIEELQVKRLKKRKLQLKDQIARLEDKLIPDILA